MNIVFISNFMNHHQLSLCNYLYNNCESFYFVCMDKMPESTKNFGYNDLSNLPYVINYEEGEDYVKKIESLVLSCDVAIFGANSSHFLKLRMAENKLSFIFSERLFKLGTYRRFIPPIRKKVNDRFTNYKNSNLYVLASSCYLSYDLSLIGFSKEKCFKWGYFTQVENLNQQEVLENKSKVFTICWVGRFIKLKRAKDLIKSAYLLKKQNFKFKINFVGSGELLNNYKKLVKKYKLDSYVEFLKNMPQENVREVMKSSHALVFSSNFKEGWGAVVNEAMSSYCVPVVSHAVGSSKFLVNNYNNGLIYKMGSCKDLTKKLKFLIENPEVCNKMAVQAHNTISTIYNGEVAGKRLIEFSSNLLNNNGYINYENGPLSSAEIIKNNWFKG